MRSLLLLVISFSFFTSIFSQDKKHIEHVIASDAFGKERKVYVQLPETYSAEGTDTFMVVYVLDAHADWYWNMAKSNVHYLASNYQVVPMIAVGIHTDDRGSEFVPQPDDPNADTYKEGTAHLLQKHIREEVIPLIEKTYRVNDTRAIVGHSRGGSFVAHTLFSDQSDLFDGYIGISPGMHYIENKIFKDAEAVLKTGGKMKKFFYCTNGTVGELEHAFGKQVMKMDSLINKYPNASLNWKHKTIPGATHWTVVIPSWNDGLVEFSRHLGVDQKMIEDYARNKGQKIRTQAEAFYVEQEKYFGKSVRPDLGSLRYYAGQFDEMGDRARAIEMYEWALEMKPDDIRTLRNFAWVYRQEKDFGKAKGLYTKALGHLEEQKADMKEEQYAKTKENLMEQIKKCEEAKE